MEFRKCPVCDGYEITFMLKRDFHYQKDIVPFEAYDVVVCKSCGFVYASPVGDYDLDKYYAELSKYEIDCIALLDQNRYDTISEFLITAGIDKNARILDIGCSVGGLLATLKKKGFCNLEGLDPSLKCKEFAKNNFDIEIINGSIGKTIGKKYNLIILEAVLEHIIDIGYVMKYIESIADDNCKIYIGVPNIDDFRENISGVYQEFSVEHINFFSEDSLKNLMGKNLFQLVSIKKCDYEIFSLWEKSDKKQSNILKDNQSFLAINNYIEMSEKRIDKIKKILSNYSDREILVWGAGTQAATLLDKTPLKNMDILAFVDSNLNYYGKNINGVRIILPKDIHLFGNVPILVATKAAQESILNCIQSLGLPNEIIKIY